MSAFTTTQLSLEKEASNLLCYLLSCYNPDYGLGHMTPSIYDTAWVSMVSKDNEWLFPSAFQYILDRQAPSGGWESSSVIDSILNSLSSLLALNHHSKSTDNAFSSRINKAQSFLSSLLITWDVSSTERVGFEITVPTMLSALSKQGINFEFSGSALLMDLNEAKLSMIKPQIIYAQHTSILHCLEGLIGHIDFDKVSHHKRHGSFMASPSSTAAYLMHASMWDDECEAYLREVLVQCEIYGIGSVPCAWPTTFFELSWIVCNLHDAGFNFGLLDEDALTQISAILKQGIEDVNGTAGFALGACADADDSAKVVTALHHLRKPTSVDPLCDAFELETHFQCYLFERNPSITVQCNVLLALLKATESSTKTGDRRHDIHSSSVLKVVSYISVTWWTTNKEIEDKWHNSKLYVLLLVAQSLTKFMLLFDKGHFFDFPEVLVQTKTPIALFQILTRILQAQQVNDGSWGSCEETAYALITLTTLCTLPFTSIMHPTIKTALRSGRQFLLANMCGSDALDTKDKCCLWVDKVNYRIPPVSYSYVLAALRLTASSIPEAVSSNASTIPGELTRLISIPTKAVQRFLRFYRKLPFFSDCQEWQLLAYGSEGYLFLPILKEVQKTMFGSEGMGKEPYIEYIPVGWTSANAMVKKYSSPQNCFVLMTLSLLHHQVDEFFDLKVQDEGTAALPTLRQALDDIFDKLNQERDITKMEFGDGPFSQMVRYLHKYICFIVNYPPAQRASYYDKTHLWRELKAYLLSMVKQTDDNTKYAAQTSWDTFFFPSSSYLKWVRTTGSENVSGLCSASLFMCHLAQGHDAFPTPELKYLAQACITHMCTVCRIWNDWGSLPRDIAERNINGMNFPEFVGMKEEEAKEEMRRISNYERNCLYTGLREFRERAKAVMGPAEGEALANAFELFFRGAEVYNAIYEFKDISAWKLSVINGQ